MQCPNCQRHFHESWTNQHLNSNQNKEDWGVSSTFCPGCTQVCVKIGRMAIVPRSRGGGAEVVQLGEWELIFPTRTLSYPVPQEVPTELGADYREAQLVLRDSKKASAALSRRVLQVVLREKANIKKGDLASEIQQVLDSKQLPTHLAESLDAIRNVGNFAAHPIKSTNSSAILDVEEHESEWLLGTLADLLDFYYVQPAKARARTKAVNAKLQSAGKPPLKTP